MANEITVRSRMKVVKDGRVLHDSGNVVQQEDMGSDGGGKPGFQKIGTTYELIDVTDLLTVRWVEVINLDDTNYIEIGHETGGSVFHPFLELGPGQSNKFRMADGPILAMKADTAECQVSVKCWDAP